MQKSLLVLLMVFISINLYANDINSMFLEYVMTGDIEKAEISIEKGADINAQDSNGATALMKAVYNQDINMVKMLMKYNSRQNIRIKLIYKKADTRNVVNIYGGNALIPACEKGHLDTVIFLLENTDINVNHINNLSWTALLEVTILGNDSKTYQEIVKVLLKHGADKNIKDSSGKTALDHAKERNLKNIERLLL